MMSLEINKILSEAKQHHKLGNLSVAQSLYEQITSLKPHHKAAHRALQKISKSKTAVQAVPALPELIQKLEHLTTETQNGFFEQLNTLHGLNPTDPDPVNLMAKAHIKLGQTDQAKDCFLKLTKMVPENHHNFLNLGTAQKIGGDTAGAEQQFLKAVELKPGDSGSLAKLAMLYAETKQDEKFSVFIDDLVNEKCAPVQLFMDLAEALQVKSQNEYAITMLGKALFLYPDEPNILVAFGMLTDAEGNTDAAVKSYKHCLTVDKYNHIALNNLGAILNRRGELEQALSHFFQSMRAKPDFVNAIVNYGAVLLEMGRLREAEMHLSRAIELDPNSSNAHFNIAQVWARRGVIDQACEKYIENTKQFPSAYKNHNALGVLFFKQRNYPLSRQYFEKAIELNPDFTESYNNLGTLYRKVGKLDVAENYYLKSIQIKPDNNAFTLLSLLQLVKGNFVDGWKLYEDRFNNEIAKVKNFESARHPLWQGEAGRKILLWGEQGLGDIVMFSQILNQVIERSCHVYLAIDRRLISLFKQSFSSEKLTIIETTQKFKELDFECHISMGTAYAKLRPIPTELEPPSDAYLSCDEGKQASIRMALGCSSDKTLVGISWFSKNKEVGNERTVSLQTLASLFDPDRYEMVNLQYGDVRDELAELTQKTGLKVHAIGDADFMGDLNEFAHLVSICDQVVSVDNTAVHFSGALGIPTYVLLPFDPDWRWGLETEQSYLYRGHTLLRQKQPFDWSDPFARLQQIFSPR